MADLVLVSAILTGARREADKENDPHVSDAELLLYMQQSWKRLYAIYAKAWPERYRTEQTITSTGVAGYAVPAAYMGTIAVDYKESPSVYIELELLQEEERNLFNGVASGRSVAYRVLGDGASAAVNLYPTPVTGQVYRHIYLPVATTLTAASQLDVMNGHDRWLELDLAIRMLNKEESDVRSRIEERDRLLADVLEEAQLRSVTTPHRIAMRGENLIDPADWRAGGRWGF